MAVSHAIKERVNELGWRQRELAQRSHVSQAIVRELQRHTIERAPQRPAHSKRSLSRSASMASTSQPCCTGAHRRSWISQ